MSDEQTAVDGANPAAPAPDVEQETPQIPANAEGQDGEAKPDDKPRDDKGRFVQERINELTKARRQAERERDHYRQLAESQPQQVQQTQSERPPTPEDFGYDLAAFGAALTEHTVKQARAQAAQEFQERQQHQSQAQLHAQYETKEREYAAAHPDYPEAFESLKSSVQFHPAVLDVLAGSEHGPAIVHHLGTHLDVADRLSRMSPVQAAYELARIEASVSAPRPKPVTKAPAPAPTLAGGSTSKAGLHDDLPIDEWMRRARG